jgi:hypothetical protein
MRTCIRRLEKSDKTSTGPPLLPGGHGLAWKGV